MSTAWIPSPNRTPRRSLLHPPEVDRLILHHTTGSLSSAIDRFKSPEAKVSAHYIVDRDGSWTQMVSERDVAYHAGNWEMNCRSLGIEIVSSKATPFMTVVQNERLVTLVQEILGRHPRLTLAGILPHRKVVATLCPSYIWPTDADLEAWKKEYLHDAK